MTVTPQADTPEVGRTRTLRIEPVNMGQKPGLNYDDIEGLICLAEGEDHR